MVALTRAEGQGTFVNLDFEACTVPHTSNTVGAFVPTDSAFPGWSVLVGGDLQTDVPYNSFGFASLSLIGNPYYNPPLGGQFSAFFATYRTLGGKFVSLSQTGTIPADANSLFYRVSGPNYREANALQIEFAGHTLPARLWDPSAAATWAVDLRPYAGQTGELKLTASFGSFGFVNLLVDDLVFSPTVVPEPRLWLLLGLGALALVLFKARRGR